MNKIISMIGYLKLLLRLTFSKPFRSIPVIELIYWPFSSVYKKYGRFLGSQALELVFYNSNRVNDNT